jgi:hypothetical protein
MSVATSSPTGASIGTNESCADSTLAVEVLTDSFGDELWSALAAGRRSRNLGASGLPVARLALPGRSSSTYYTVTTIDGRGRLADRSPLRKLRWPPGLPIAVSVVSGAIVVVSRSDGRELITRQGHLRLPVHVRRTCRLTAGDRLLVLASLGRRFLVVYPMSTLDAMVLGHHDLARREAS